MRVPGSRPASRAANTAARSWSRVPGAPACWRARAIAVIRSSAAIASAGGSSRPARAAFPEDSGQVSTRASARAWAARRRSAAGSTYSTIDRSAARSWPVVIDPAIPMNAIATAAACRSVSPASSLAKIAALARSIRPATSAASTAGSRIRSRARVSSTSADRPVSTSAAASSSLTCSLARELLGRAAARIRRASSSATAASSTPACQDDSRRDACSTPASSSSDSRASPASSTSWDRAASAGPGGSTPAGPPSAKLATSSSARRSPAVPKMASS